MRDCKNNCVCSVNKQEIQATFAQNLMKLLEMNNMEPCDLLEYFPIKQRNGETKHFTKEDIKELKSKGRSTDRDAYLSCKIKPWLLVSGKKSRLPEYADLLKLCSIFNCDTDYLLKDHVPVSKDISNISEYMGLSPYTIEKISKYRDELKELIDKLVDADWVYRWFRGYDVARGDCLSMLLSRICSTLVEYKNDVPVYWLNPNDGIPRYTPSFEITSAKITRYETIETFIKILDGLIEDAEENRIQRGEQ